MKTALLRTGVFGLALAVALAVQLATDAPADACGGCVCAPGFAPPDQANERVLFALADDGAAGTLLTAVIQIQYTGAVEDFAWVLPVPEVPENVDVADPGFFTSLDAATAPTFQFPFGGGGAVGCSVFGCAAGRAAPGFDTSDSGGSGPVNVWGTGGVGPYEMAIISGDTVEPLIEWIYRHGYGVPDEFVSIADDYVKENYKFVVVRLAPEAGVDQLQPLVLQYHEENPCVPLRLTSVAAIPDMGVRVYIVGDSRAVPINYGTVSPDYTKLATTPNLAADYDPFLAGEVETAGGKAWVTEYASPTDNLAGLLTGGASSYFAPGRYLTRLYTKISPWEMDEDPFFDFDPNGLDVSNVHAIQVSGTAGAAVVGRDAAALGDVFLVSAIVGLFAARRFGKRRAR
ncbi:MAG TPA: DUF2330 domain-containing protein [Myxococcota bacterium]|jgi:hypothetical protein|nr:DUF2330 domain-containing protein [Myxococcota bacterium]